MADIAVLYESNERTPMVIEQRHKDMLQLANNGDEIRYFTSEAEMLATDFDCDVLITWGQLCPNEYCNRSKKIKWIQILSAGAEGVLNLDVVKSGKAKVTKMAGMHGIPMSESVICYMLMFINAIPQLMVQQRNHKWEKPVAPSATECMNLTVSIIGMGDIGSEVAKRSKFLGMKVIGCRRHPRPTEYVDEMYSTSELEHVLSISDFVVCLVPASPEAEKMFGKEQFEAMKDSAVFINVGRGMVVDTDAMIEALKDGTIAGAALDAFDVEPLPEDSPLWDMENVIITPHYSAYTPYYFDRAFTIISDNMNRFFNGEPLNGLLN